MKKAKEAAAKSSDAEVLLQEESDILRGTYREYGEYMVAPTLVDHLGTEITKDFTRQKGGAKLRDLQVARSLVRKK